MKGASNMNLKKINRLIIFISVFVAITIFGYNQVSLGASSPSSRKTPPPTTLPPPVPTTKQLWPEASFLKWETPDIIKALKNNNLEVVDVKPGYTLGPVPAREGIIFLMPSYGADIGGYVSSYNTEDDIEEMREHYLEMNKDPESPAWWIYEKDNILLLISGKIPKATAEEYGKVLNEIGKPH